MGRHDARSAGQRNHYASDRTIAMLALLAAFFLPLGGCRKPVDHPEIRTVLDDQLDAWNRGDLEGFMTHYWKSDDLIFASRSGQTRGWPATLERYRRRYPTRASMGMLHFDIGEIASTGKDTAEVAGRYRVTPADGRQSTGRFYLHFKRFDGTWKIVRDFTVQD